MLPGIHHHRAKVRNAPLAPKDDLFVQRRAGQIPVDPVQVGQAVVLQAVNRGQFAGLGLRIVEPAEIDHHGHMGDLTRFHRGLH